MVTVLRLRTRAGEGGREREVRILIIDISLFSPRGDLRSFGSLDRSSARAGVGSARARAPRLATRGLVVRVAVEPLREEVVVVHRGGDLHDLRSRLLRARRARDGGDLSLLRVLPPRERSRAREDGRRAHRAAESGHDVRSVRDERLRRAREGVADCARVRAAPRPSRVGYFLTPPAAISSRWRLRTS